MKTAIYYFTGTGNSLAAAMRIARALGDARLIPIASLPDQDAIVPQADRVGIVCPVYDCGLPVIVAEFAQRLDLSGAGYTFGVVTMGGMGVSALHQLDGILNKQGRGLDAGFAVAMPANFPPVGRPPEGEKRGKILADANERLDGIAGTIGQGIPSPPGPAPLSRLVKGLMYGSFAGSVHEADTRFSVSDECTACGTCARVCPVGNISLADDRPVWHHRCELCCACLHFCPTEAIQLAMLRGTEGRGRYLHPDLTVAKMRAQREGVPPPDEGV